MDEVGRKVREGEMGMLGMIGGIVGLVIRRFFCTIFPDIFLTQSLPSVHAWRSCYHLSAVIS